MKHSIKKIFNNLNYYLTSVLIILIISFIFIVEQYHSYNKVEILKEQKEIISQLTLDQKDSNIIDIIQFNAKLSKLQSQNKILQEYIKTNYITKYIFEDKNYKSTLDKINENLNKFNKESRIHFDLKKDDKKMLFSSKEKIRLINYSISKDIDKILIENISYDMNRFNIFSIMILLSIFLYSIIIIWYKNRLNFIYKDIKSLFSIDNDLKNIDIFSHEADSIAMRMKRKTGVSQNPVYMDQITQIYNGKGMIYANTQRKGLNENNSICVAIIEIDNFSKSKRTYSQEFTQLLLKKVAYTISLHQQAPDIIARTDYNQFTLIFSRPAKDQLFKDIDLVRQSISEMKVTSPDETELNITVTGSFVTKVNNSPLEESIKKCKELLYAVKDVGINRIFQIKDLPK